MTTVSFIVTSYNIEAYIEKCLDSVVACAVPGDEIILVDDGSSDETAEKVSAFAANIPEAVAFHPVFLGANTFGGVGVAANIGLNEARRETVFFVDGDDWLDIEVFKSARKFYAGRPTDILILNYLEHDQARDALKQPADHKRWAQVGGAKGDDLRLQALSFIAVPWRKFYRRSFLEEHALRYPEGPFFFEDNPFHWRVCLAAQSIAFLNKCICFHRVNRPGQTMASTGEELTAFFTHFQTILSDLPSDDPKLITAASSWLLNNMSWHLNRLRPSARFGYAQAASKSLQLIDDDIWNVEIASIFSNKSVWSTAQRLRFGDVFGWVDSCDRRDITNRLATISDNLAVIKQQQDRVARDVTALKAMAHFKALKARPAEQNPAASGD